MEITRRTAIAATLAAPAIVRAATTADTVVVGAGVFGAWTARALQLAGRRVTLIDAWGPANARAASGGETRMTRGSYGRDAIYTQMATASLADWRALSGRAGLPVLMPCGVLFFFARTEPFVTDTVAAHRQLGLPIEVLDAAALRRRFPQIDFAGIEVGLFEPQFGALLARRAVQTLVAEFVAAGGTYRQAAVAPPGDGARLDTLVTAAGERIGAAEFVFACGPWLPKLFPALLGPRIFPTRQEVFFFRPPAGDARFEPAAMPGWADWNGGDIVYGFPDIEARGCKIAFDRHGPPIDPDGSDRTPGAAGLSEARAYLGRRFPSLAGAPLNEARVCQYENSASGDFLIDRHPRWANVVLAGGGSGHGFKHGPEVGRRAAALQLDPAARPEPRFAFAAMRTTQQRAVH